MFGCDPTALASQNSPYKRSMFWRDAPKSQEDVICIQETHLLKDDVRRLKHKKFPFIFHSSVDSKRASAAILIKDTVTFQLNSSSIDPKGRYVTLQCLINSREFTILSLYAPNSQQISFLRK